MTLATSYMGLQLAHPFMLGASPLTAHVDNIRRVEDGGAAAIVMHSLFEEQISGPPRARVSAMQRHLQEFTAGFAHFPRPQTFPLDPHDYLEQIRRIRSAVSIPVVASINCSGPDGWLPFVPLLADAGANALELNIYSLSTEPDDAPRDVEQRIEQLVSDVKTCVAIPVAVKLTPFYTAFASFAARLDRAGADGLVLFNRFYHPDIDVDTLEMLPNLRLSTSDELQLRLHWLAALYDRVAATLVATGGAHTALDGVKAVLSGAHAVQMVAAVLQQGPQHFRTMEDGLRYWMSRHQFDAIEDFRGHAGAKRRLEAAESERSNYREILRAWSS